MKTLFYIVVALQLVFLVIEAASNQLTLAYGNVVTLKTAPVDPRSLFMGNYMALSFDITQLDLSIIPHDESSSSYQQGSTVYVSLQNEHPYARPVYVSGVRPRPGRGQVVIRGRVAWIQGNRMVVGYGIERKYIPEGKEREVSRLQWRQNSTATVEVSVDGSGQALIRQVLVNGKPLDLGK